MNANTRVIVADDPHIVSALSDREFIEVVAAVSDGDALLDRSLELRPDVAVVRLGMPGLDSPLAIARLRKRLPRCRLLVLTQNYSDELVVPVVSAGASAYLPRHAEPEQLVAAVEALARGEVYFDPRAVKVLARKLIEA